MTSLAMVDEEQKPQPLQGHVAIVTSTSGGIGREITIHLALKGAKILLVYSSNPQKAQEVAATINSSAPVTAAIASRADISNLAQVIGLLNKAKEAFRTIHIIVNNMFDLKSTDWMGW
ncbi:hypothetical protein SUGI_0275460 [Cryptomeria japonica]|nr:hypothetical protein SUGI_0275460 [Cryptomeria japonica]